MISRQKSQFYVAILQPRTLLRHTDVAQERKQKLCLLYEIDENVWLHRERKALETGLLKKLRIDASKNRSLELACLENPVWENETPRLWIFLPVTDPSLSPLLSYPTQLVSINTTAT